MKKLGRRALLQALGTSAAALPILRSPLLCAQSDVRRLILMFSPNGTVLDQDDEWTPTGGERDFTFSRLMQPLSPYREHLLILSGVNMSPGTGVGDPHQKGMGQLWTATELNRGDFKLGAGWAGGISVDQFLAPKVQGPARFRSYEMGVRCEDFDKKDIWTRMCYAAADRPVDPTQDPVKSYQDLLLSAQPPKQDPASVQKSFLRARSLAAAAGQFERMKNYLGHDDARKIELHLDSVRDIEKTLITSSSQPQECGTLDVPTLDFRSHANFEKVGQLQMRILVEAMACDQVRVGSLQFNQAVGYMSPNFIALDGKAIAKPHHELSHWRGGDISDPEILKNPLWAKRATKEVHLWYAKQMATLMGLLKERDMLSSTLVVWGNELGDGDKHSLSSIPFVLGGNVNGYFQTGRFLRYNNAPHGGLLVSICNAMGVPVTAFGMHKGGPLPRLT